MVKTYNDINNEPINKAKLSKAKPLYLGIEILKKRSILFYRAVNQG